MDSILRFTSVVVTLAVFASVAQAQVLPPIDTMEDVNVVGLGVGAAPDYMGSSDNTVGVGPFLRYQFEGTQRYFLLLGPLVQVNILDDENWRFGPQVNYRFGRDSDVDDERVSKLEEIDDTVEGGAFVTYRLKLSQERMHQINFGADVGAGSNGTVGSLRAMYWQPLGPTTFLNLGAGVTMASDKWMNTYFGIDSRKDIALYPSLKGEAFDAGSGVKSVVIPFGVTQALSKEWLVSLGGRYEKLLDDAEDSPVTSVSGDSAQWIYGLGASYLF